MIIKNVELEGRPERLSIGWQDAMDRNARYHIWVDRKALLLRPDADRIGTIYKNSVAAFREPGHFDTRRLDASAKVWRQPLEDIWRAVREDGLWDKLEEKNRQEARQRAADAALEERAHMAREAGPALLDALQALLAACDGIAGASVPQSIKAQARSAIVKATRRKAA